MTQDHTGTKRRARIPTSQAVWLQSPGSLYSMKENNVNKGLARAWPRKSQPVLQL